MTTIHSSNHVQQTHNRARQFLDTNNSLTSKISDQMVSLLEAGEGSFYLRDQIDNILNDIIVNNSLRVTKPTTTRMIGYDWTKLRQLMSIKDKIAYVVAIETTRDNTTRGNPIDVIVPENDIKAKINTVVCDLENRLLQNQEFTESWILRHAAINRFSCKLTAEHTTKLNEFSTKIKKICTDNGFDILAEANDFTFESDAQKIIKIDETIRQLSAMGIVIPDDINTDFGKFAEYIKPLRDLDKAYKHLTNTLNMIHETAKTTDKSMVTPKQKQKLVDVMNKLELRETIEKRITDFNDEEKLDTISEHGTPMELLNTIKRSSKFNETVSEMGIENDFDQWFLSRVTFELTHGAHSLLTKKKAEAFKGDEKKYDEDCNSRRGMMRRRIFEVYDNNNTGEVSATWDFENDADYERMNSYYTKFPNLFFNNPEDNYNNVDGANPADVCARHFDKMRSILAALIRRRVPSMRSSDRIRRGSYPKIIIERARHALKGDQRGIFKWIERQIEWTDDASILAMTIMFQNEANNKLFYQDKDPFEPKQKRYSKIFKKIAGAEKGRKAIKEKFAPATNVALKATETTVKGVLGATAWTAQKGANIINTPLETINEWLSKQSGWNPIKLGMIATKPMQRLLNPLSKGIKTGKDGERITITEGLSKSYKTGTEALPVKEGEEKKTRYLYQWLTKGIGAITEFFGKTVADSGQWMHDKYTTASQRNVLGALYEAGQKEDRWKDLMRSGDLENMLDLRNIGPKLFDEDGRILPVDKPAEKYPEDEEGIEKLQKDIFGKQYDEVQSQIKDYFSSLRGKFDQLDKKLDNIAYGTPEYENIQKQLANLGIQMDTWKDKSDSLNAISVAIQKIATGVSTRGDFKGEIDGIVTDMETDLNTGEKTVKDNKDIITTCDSEIKKKKVEKEKIEKELSLISTGDEKTEDLKTQLKDKNIDEGTLETEQENALQKIKDHENEILKIEDENKEIKEKIEKLGSEDENNKNNLKYDEELSIENSKLEQKKSDLTTLHSIDSLIRDAKTTLEEIDKNIKKGSLSPDDQEKLEKEKSETEEKIRDLEIKQKNKNSILNTLKDEIRKINDKIEDIKRKRGRKDIKNEDFYEIEIGKLKITLQENKDKIRSEKANKDLQEAELQKINKKLTVLTNEIKEIKDKIKSKGGVALSRLELNDKKTSLETEIESEEEKKKNANKKIEKQEITNRVLKKIHQWGVKVHENADILADFDNTTKYKDDKKRRKLLKQTIGNLDLSFEKKTEATTTTQQITQQTNSNVLSTLTAPAPTV